MPTIDFAPAATRVGRAVAKASHATMDDDLPPRISSMEK